MTPEMRAFGADSRGAITIEWVVVTAVILVVGLETIYAIFNWGISSTVTDVDHSSRGVNIGGTALPPQKFGDTADTTQVASIVQINSGGVAADASVTADTSVVADTGSSTCIIDLLGICL